VWSSDPSRSDHHTPLERDVVVVGRSVVGLVEAATATATATATASPYGRVSSHMPVRAHTLMQDAHDAEVGETLHLCSVAIAELMSGIAALHMGEHDEELVMHQL